MKKLGKQEGRGHALGAAALGSWAHAASAPWRQADEPQSTPSGLPATAAGLESATYVSRALIVPPVPLRLPNTHRPRVTRVCTRWHRLFWAHSAVRSQLALRAPLTAQKRSPCLYEMDVADAEKLLASQHRLVARLSPHLAAFSLAGGHAVQHAAHRCGAWDVSQLLHLLPAELVSLQIDYCRSVSFS